MSTIETLILHNPRCSKSRQALAVLAENGAEAQVIEYLRIPLTPTLIKRVLHALNCTPREIMRPKEAPYHALNLANPALSETQLIEALCANPILLERPIILRNNQAVIGRPPENVLKLLRGT
jgi:arsenate reductase (glutaredoxin)